MSDERLERLEQRIETLEALVRQLASTRLPPEAPGPAARPPIADAPREAAPAIPPLRDTRPEGVAPRRPAAGPVPPLAPEPRAPAIDSETWLGQRGLLGVGVLALVLAAGYFLQLAIERNWVTPVARCVGGVMLGGAVGALGWRLIPRSRGYGTSLVGAGAAVMYLAVWAACRLYGLLPPVTGIAALALVSVSLALVALALSAEPLAFIAGAGAYAAPLLLGSDRGNTDALLVYVLCMAVGLGAVAARRAWRATTGMLTLGAAAVGLLVVRDANALLLLGFGTALGALGLRVALARGWVETRFVAFLGGWAIVFGAADHLAGPRPLLAAAVVFAAPVWYFAWTRYADWTIEQLASSARPRLLSDVLYFLALPFPLLEVLRRQAPAYVSAHPGSAALALAVPYLAAGLQAPRLAFAAIGTLLLVFGLDAAVPDSPGVLAMLAVAPAWLLIDRLRRRPDAGALALGAFVVALLRLLGEFGRRAADEAAFIGPWALALWGTLAVGVLLARRWSARGDGRPAATGTALWVTSLLLLLGGVTSEIDRAWSHAPVDLASARLASGLSVSAWWLAVAATLVVLGFRRDWKPVRLGGLLVAAVAIGKVLLVDLSELDALYRVASVAILAVVSLSLAWLYRKAPGRESASGASGGVDDTEAAG